MDDCEFVNQFQIYAHEYPSLGEFINPQFSAISQGETLQQSLSSESYTSSYDQMINHKRSSDCTTSTITDQSNDGLCEIFERPNKQIKNSTNTSNQPSSNSPTSSCFANLISFANSTHRPSEFPGLLVDQGQVKHEDMNSDGSIYGNNNNNYYAANEGKRNPSLAKDHVIAERKRREKLNEKFVALSAIIPGLKKLDKASVIGDAIKYLKQLEEHVKSLEEKAKTKRPEESVFKSRLSIDDDSSSCDESCISEEIMPDIEARVAEKNVLIRIHSKKKNGLLVKLLTELQKLHLNVVNSSVLPFGEYALDITIVAQMDDEFSMRVRDLARNLQLVIS